jgi:hypothetical protein
VKNILSLTCLLSIYVHRNINSNIPRFDCHQVGTYIRRKLVSKKINRKFSIIRNSVDLLIPNGVYFLKSCFLEVPFIGNDMHRSEANSSVSF